MKKRLFAVALTALIPATGMLVYNEVWYRAQRDAEIHDQALQASRQVASEVDRIFEGVKSLLTATAVVPSVTGSDTTRCNSVLSEITAAVESVATISMVDPNGVVVCSSMPDRNGTNIADRPYFQQALTSDEFVIGGYTRGRVSGSDVLPVAKAVKRGGQLRGVLVSGLNLGWFQARMLERGTLAEGFVSIADANGVVVARTPPIANTLGTKISAEYMHLLHEPRSGTIEATSRDGVSRVIGFQPVSHDSPLYIAAGVSRDKAFEAVNRGTLTAALLILLSGAIAAAAAVLIGNRFIIRPISKIVSVIQRWSGGEVSARTDMRGKYGEVGQVASAVDELLDELDRRRVQAEEAEAARVFLTRELSHRVKNTLSVVQAIARQTFGKVAPQQALETYSLRVRALAGAHDSLLAEDWESADIHDVVQRAIAPHREPGDNRFRLEGPGITLPPKAVVAVSLILHELATNAAKYGALRDLSGHVDVTWTKADDRVRLEWVESGGPEVTKPEREGFGTKVISRAFGAEFDAAAAFDYRPEGLRFSVEFSPPEKA